MQTSYISTQSLWNAPRSATARLQAESAKATQEVASGRYGDVGLELGSRVSVSLALRGQQDQLAALKQDNGLTALRLDQTQATLKQLQAAADDTLKQLLGASIDKKVSTISTLAATQLAALTSALNGAANGQYLFAGLNTDKAPLTAYAGSPTSPAKAAVDQAFQAAFGSADPATITPAQMTAFLNGPLAQLFDEAHWTATWSSASSDALTSRIAPDETARTSVSANAEPIRSLAMAYVLASALKADTMSAATQTVIADKITSLLSQGSQGLVGLQADLGTVQARIKDANTRMDAQKSLIASRIDDLEGVDPAEAKTRLDRLNAQIQMSYSLTSQLRQLSLVNYL
ncbi:flagellar hook-associated family protein [Methylobacterium sp. WSM2598]|uniref:flagellar hook-associated family protein n=1 Tax=Methylobacterium sp. WSM2598 TaxID=398261 RepID=UPI000382D5A3|nr:flagellar hook-associated family protein [Methylobacterium sp. WSM2598]